MAVAGEVVVPVCLPSVRVRVSLAIADAFMFLSFATLWLFFAAFATMVFWRHTCGEECIEFQVWKMTAFLLAWCSANTVLLYMLPRIRSDSGAEVPPEKELRPHTVLGDSAFLGFHVIWVFLLRTIIGDLPLLKGISTGGIGSARSVGLGILVLLHCHSHFGPENQEDEQDQTWP